MTGFLIRKWVRNYKQTEDPAVRGAYGKLAGITGIIANALLFALKLAAGLLTGSLAVIADAFNNLSDAASSVVTLFGFVLSEAPPDSEHPFGHGRMEYLSAMLLGELILLAGYELLKSSVSKIFHPEPSEFRWLSVGILLAAIAVKCWMMLFYRKLGRAISSETLAAASADSRNDMLCTGLVLVSLFAEKLTGLAVDGYMGLLVAALVLWTGITTLKDSISPLLGKAPDPELVREIRDTVLAHEGIVGVHDLMIHNYGPGRTVISLHAEVPASEDVLRSHDRVDSLERELMHKFHAVTCIHMDPVDTENAETARLKVLAETVLGDIDPRLSLHDFRVVFGETHTNLIFDITVPFRYEGTESLPAELQRRLQAIDPHLYVVAQAEHSYI